jgi:hypothetical protein
MDMPSSPWLVSHIPRCKTLEIYVSLHTRVAAGGSGTTEESDGVSAPMSVVLELGYRSRNSSPRLSIYRFVLFA